MRARELLMQPLPVRRYEARATALRILHVDDEADIREVVELSLGLDPTFAVRSCPSGADALVAAADWSPDLILCDAIMPVMDGPATLLRLRTNPKTANVPVVFMTGLAHGGEVEELKALGAVGVIAKPFDPMTLADAIRGHLRTAGLAVLRLGFSRRLRADAAVLTQCRADLVDASATPAALGQIRMFAHALAGAAGIFGFQQITVAAAALESATRKRMQEGAAIGVEDALDALLADIERAHSARE
jgi:CheY-like chemotaxis protein